MASSSSKRRTRSDFPIKTQHDFDIYENMLVVGSGSYIDRDRLDVIGPGLRKMFRVYAESYHRLVLQGKMEAFDIEDALNDLNLEGEQYQKQKADIIKFELEHGIIKENDKGEFEYDN